jgi:hypothetical protein
MGTPPPQIGRSSPSLPQAGVGLIFEGGAAPQG